MVAPKTVRTGSPAGVLAAVFLGICAVGCASSAITALDGPALSPALRSQEQELWMRSRAHEEALAESGQLYRDAALESYLDDLVLTLSAERFAGGVQPSVRVVASLEPNAAVYPHGTLMVTTGLLLAARSEAELAMALSHELAHYRLRHGLRAARAGRRHSAIGTALGAVSMAALAVTTGVLAPDLISSGAAYSALATRGYGRDLEREADAEGLQMLFAAGYDPEAAVSLLEQLRAAQPETSESTLWSTHPAVEERIGDVRVRVAELSARFRPSEALRRERAQRYRRATERALLFDAELELERRDFAAARRAVDRVLEADPRSPAALLMAAEVARRSAPPGADLEAQVQAYRIASRADPTLAAPYLELALLQRRLGHTAAALASFEAYLERAPREAPLTAIARGYAERLRARLSILAPAQRAPGSSPEVDADGAPVPEARLGGPSLSPRPGPGPGPGPRPGPGPGPGPGSDAAGAEAGRAGPEARP